MVYRIICFILENFFSNKSKRWFYSHYGWQYNYDTRSWELQDKNKERDLWESFHSIVLKKAEHYFGLPKIPYKPSYLLLWHKVDKAERSRMTGLMEKYRNKKATAFLSTEELEIRDLDGIVDVVLSQNPKEVQQYKKLDRVPGMLMGKIMQSNKQLNPELVKSLLMQKLINETIL